ncbi:MAG: acylneuraminate cytidylyltransferase family protein [bacterium]|nr:acylneuraminate cytidylyltransferase family protein [bacterium]
MYKGKKILGIIPARGGSKGLPQKNILPLLGKPLIAWTIEEARSSKYIDKIIVSTDDEKIAVISRKYGAEVPFIRPKELATDNAKTIDVILNIQKWFEGHNDYYDAIMVLQPTSPLRKKEHIRESVELFYERGAQSVISVAIADKHPWWCNTLPSDGCMSRFLPKKAQNNRQKLPEYYCLNGAIYLTDWKYFKDKRSFWGPRTYAYKMEKRSSIDIDDKLDFAFAELILSKKAQKK